ncbi:MAG: hypothetical protein RSG77_21855 [Hafnia sp.]
MATMIIDYGDGTQATINTPDEVGEIETSELTKALSEWLGSSLQGVSKRRSIIEELEKHNWERTEQTQPLFEMLNADVEEFRGSPLASRSVDFLRVEEQ